MGEKYQIHPLAETYPPMSEAEMEALTADIAARGLQRPIVLFEGKILDGRNRYLACQRANVEPAFEEYAGEDPEGQVDSLNLNRDLTAGQRALVAARKWLRNGNMKWGGQRSKLQPVTCQSLAKKFRASPNTIIQARDLLSEAPDLVMVVESCVRSLAFATEELEERRKKAKQEAHDAAKVAEYTEAISNGQVSLEEAIKAVMAQEREEKDRLHREAEARQIWFEHVERALTLIEDWVAKTADDHLAWHVEPGAPGTGHGITRERIASCVMQLGRIDTFVLGESSNGSGHRTPKGRKATA